MLFLSVRVGRDYYAIPTADIVEILPLVNLKSIPQAPHGVVGLLDMRGTAVPVVDLSLLATGVKSRASMTTRIALLNYRPDGHSSDLLGLVAEEMTDTFQAVENDFVESGVDTPQAAYLGPVIKRGDRIVQRVDIEQLIPPQVRAVLFQSVKSQESPHG